MRYTLIGLLQVAGVAGTLAYAAGNDAYYAPDDVSRWEHATRDGGATLLASIIAIAAAISFGFLAQGLVLKRRRVVLIAIPAVALYCVLPLFAYAVLSLGH